MCSPNSVQTYRVVFSLGLLLASFTNALAADGDLKDVSAASRQSEFETLAFRIDAALMAAVDNNNAPWEMFTNRLEEKIRGKSVKWDGITLVSIPLQAEWNHPTYGNYNAWRVLADAVPKYQSTYYPSSSWFTDGYHVLITNISIPLPDPKDSKKAEDARKKYIDITTQLSTAYRNVPTNWADFNNRQKALPDNRRMSFDSWFAKFDGAIIAQLMNKRKPIALEYSKWIGEAQKGYAFAADLLTEFDNPAYQLPATSPDGLTLPYRTYNITPDLTKWIDDSKKLVAKSAAPALEFSFDQRSNRTKTEDTKLGGGGFLWTPFFSVGGSGGYNKLEVNTKTADFKLDFKCANISQFTIQPGRWYNSSAVKVFKKGPWIKGGPVDTGMVELWGEKGLMSLRPSVLVVAYQPSIAVRMSSTDFNSVKTAVNAGGSIRIGPFGFGADYSKKTSDISFDSSLNTMTATDTGETPQIVAIINEIPNE